MNGLDRMTEDMFSCEVVEEFQLLQSLTAVPFIVIIDILEVCQIVCKRNRLKPRCDREHQTEHLDLPGIGECCKHTSFSTITIIRTVAKRSPMLSSTLHESILKIFD